MWLGSFIFDHYFIYHTITGTSSTNTTNWKNPDSAIVDVNKPSANQSEEQWSTTVGSASIVKINLLLLQLSNPKEFCITLGLTRKVAELWKVIYASHIGHNLFTAH